MICTWGAETGRGFEGVNPESGGVEAGGSMKSVPWLSSQGSPCVLALGGRSEAPGGPAHPEHVLGGACATGHAAAGEHMLVLLGCLVKLVKKRVELTACTFLGRERCLQDP